MEFLTEWWGRNEDISPLQIAARGAVMFFIALVLIRLSGMRPFGKDDPFDTVVAFLIGGILSRGIVGATPFVSAIVGAIVLVVIHKLLSKAAFFRQVEKSLKGKSTLLYKNGKFIRRNMRIADVTEADIMEELHLEFHTDKLTHVKEIYMENTGEISFVRKE